MIRSSMTHSNARCEPMHLELSTCVIKSPMMLCNARCESRHLELSSRCDWITCDAFQWTSNIKPIESVKNHEMREVIQKSGRLFKKQATSALVHWNISNCSCIIIHFSVIHQYFTNTHIFPQNMANKPLFLSQSVCTILWSSVAGTCFGLPH